MLLSVLLALSIVDPTTLTLSKSQRMHAPIAQLSDDAVAAKIASVQARRKRTPRQKGALQATRTLPEPLVLHGNENSDVPVWNVPEHLRMPGGAPVSQHGFHKSLSEVFPGSGLDEAWDTNSALRTALRRALRTDLFSPPASWSEIQARRLPSLV